MVHRVQVFQDNFNQRKPKFMEPIKTIEFKKKEKTVLKTIDNKLVKFFA